MRLADYVLPAGEGKTLRGHRLSVTGVALTADDTTGFSVSKDGAVLRWDIETQKRAKMLLPGGARPDPAAMARAGSVVGPCSPLRCDSC